MKNILHNEMSFIDYVHVFTKFLVLNDKNISKICKNQGKKLHNLYLNDSHHNFVTSHDPDKVIFNFSDHVLNTTEKSLLSKGLNFAIPHNNINYADFMLPFALLYRDADSLEVSNLDKEFIHIDHDKILNHLIHIENRVTDVLKNLRDKKEISIEQYKDLNTSGSRLRIMYGSAKVHKIVKDGLPSFRPMLSGIGTPTYKLVKFLVPMLEPLATNEYTIKDSFKFGEKF